MLIAFLEKWIKSLNPYRIVGYVVAVVAVLIVYAAGMVSYQEAYEGVQFKNGFALLLSGFSAMWGALSLQKINKGDSLKTVIITLVLAGGILLFYGKIMIDAGYALLAISLIFVVLGVRNVVNREQRNRRKIYNQKATQNKRKK